MRGLLAYLQQAKLGYWGFNPIRPHSYAAEDTKSQNKITADGIPQPIEVANVGRGWIHSMFARDKAPVPTRGVLLYMDL